MQPTSKVIETHGKNEHQQDQTYTFIEVEFMELIQNNNNNNNYNNC